MVIVQKRNVSFSLLSTVYNLMCRKISKGFKNFPRQTLLCTIKQISKTLTSHMFSEQAVHLQNLKFRNNIEITIYLYE